MQQPKVRGRVCLVEDDSAVNEALASLLEVSGYTVEIFSSGKDFLDRFHAAPDTCLVLDFHLPDTDGVSLQQTLKESGHALPFIVISGRGDENVRKLAMAAGATRFLDKPPRGGQLLEAVACALERAA